MKKIDYFLARTLVQVSGIVFVTQLVIEVAGIATRKPGMEWVVPACAAAFFASLLYAAAVVAINAWREKTLR